MDNSYVILEAVASLTLEVMVNLKIEEGYEPVGGVAYIKDIYSTDKYIQAMFKCKISK